MAEWVRLRCTGDRVVLGSKHAAATSLRNFSNSVYPALPMSFGADTKSRRSLLSGVYIFYFPMMMMGKYIKDPTSLHWKCVI